MAATLSFSDRTVERAYCGSGRWDHATRRCGDATEAAAFARASALEYVRDGGGTMSMTYDVAVLGAGFAGVTAARELGLRGDAA